MTDKPIARPIDHVTVKLWTIRETSPTQLSENAKSRGLVSPCPEGIRTW